MKTKAEHTKGPDAPAKHTPGPWEVGPNRNLPDQEKAFDVLAPDPEKYAGIGDKMIVADYLTEGNARLIAACPDLLEALERLVNLISGDESRYDAWREDVEAAVDVIRKARGE